MAVQQYMIMPADFPGCKSFAVNDLKNICREVTPSVEVVNILLGLGADPNKSFNPGKSLAALLMDPFRPGTKHQPEQKDMTLWKYVALMHDHNPEILRQFLLHWADSFVKFHCKDAKVLDLFQVKKRGKKSQSRDQGLARFYSAFTKKS
jgi:hypothetical protein